MDLTPLVGQEIHGGADAQNGAPIAALALSALVATSVAQAQEWPTRPVTMVVPFAAGGPVDVLGRILAQYLGEASASR